MKTYIKLSLLAMLVSGMAGGARAQTSRPPSERGLARLQKEVRHELVMLPFYGVFDNFEYKVEGSTVTLLGQVTRPI